jgi:glycosyltransferase involved in cell wall biosynthesis
MGVIKAPSICLSMIVRNEAKCIKRCLDSVQDVISHWVIADTGSTDETCDIIRSELKDIPGELYHDEWRDFSHNRNFALERARAHGDYTLLLDADMALNISGQRTPVPSLTADGYYLRFEGENDYQVIRLVSNRCCWRYCGPVHEYIEAPYATNIQRLPFWTITNYEDGACRFDKFDRELRILTEALHDDPGNTRYMFYLAQTYRDRNEPEKAIEWYQRRAALGGWEEEVWYAAYQMARCKQAAGRPWSEVLHDYLEAYEMRPHRLEPLLPLSKYYRGIGHFTLAHTFSRPALFTKYPDDILFIERPVYEYALLMEHAIACYWIGDHQEAIRLNKQILQVPHLPGNYHASAVRNRQLSLVALNGNQSETSSQSPESSKCLSGVQHQK